MADYIATLETKRLKSCPGCEFNQILTPAERRSSLVPTSHHVKLIHYMFTLPADPTTRTFGLVVKCDEFCRNVFVVQVCGAAKAIGVKAGDRIWSANNITVEWLDKSQLNILLRYNETLLIHIARQAKREMCATS